MRATRKTGATSELASLRLGVAAALTVSIASLVFSMSGLAGAERTATVKPTASTSKSKAKAKSKVVAKIDGHPLAAKPYAGGLLVLSSARKFPASVIPTVKNSNELSGKTVTELTPSCRPTTVDLGTWCLEAAAYPVPSEDKGKDNFFWASQACVAAGGWLPSAAQLIGAAKRVRLESTLHDSSAAAIIDEEPADGLKDQREMSSTLVTTAAGSAAAGSEGVSAGATGDPRTGEPNPVPAPAVPEPQTLQYVTVYSNGTLGGFAGSQPVAEAQSFRCAYAQTPGAGQQSEE
jgi:hypothetical protein